MSAMVKVSVIIPVYNVAPYLGECLDSVTQQSLTDIEIICIDDCSTDDSLQLLQKYAVSDSRIRILCNDKNRDVSATRNRGIREAVGKYIFFMDSDDTFFSNNALESLYDVAITDLADVVWGRTVNWYCELGKSYYEINTLANPDKDIRKGTVAGFPVLSYNVTVWNKLLLRSFVLKYYLFFDEIQMVSDFERVINSFRATWDVSIFITGSNGKLLSGELATLLSGRYVSFRVAPFSFSEYCEMKEVEEPKDEDLIEYMNWGGMPQRFSMKSEEELRTFLKDLYNSIVLRDIVQRTGAKDIDLLNRIMEYLMANPSQTFSSQGILKYFKSVDRSVSTQTLYNYLDLVRK